MPAPTNGRYLSWGEVTIDFGGVRFDNEISGASYKETSNFTTLPGRGRRPKGRTRGKIDYEGSMKFSREAWADVVEKLGGSAWRDAIIDAITVSFGGDENPQADKLIGVMFHSPSVDMENNEDPLEVEVQMSMLDIVWHGEDENDRQ